MADFDAALGDFDNQPGLFDDWAEPPILFDDGVGLFDSALNDFDDGGINSPTIQLTGQELASEIGSLTPEISDVLALTGQEMTSEQGSLTLKVDDSLLISGQEMISEQGSIVVSTTDAIALSGQEMASEQGVIAVSTETSAFVVLVGIQLSTQTGSVQATGTGTRPVVPGGSRQPARIGGMPKHRVVKLSGVELSTQLGAVQPAATIVINSSIVLQSVNCETESSDLDAEGLLGLSQDEFFVLFSL